MLYRHPHTLSKPGRRLAGHPPCLFQSGLSLIDANFVLVLKEFFLSPFDFDIPESLAELWAFVLC